MGDDHEFIGIPSITGKVPVLVDRACSNKAQVMTSGIITEVTSATEAISYSPSRNQVDSTIACKIQ